MEHDDSDTCARAEEMQGVLGCGKGEAGACPQLLQREDGSRRAPVNEEAAGRPSMATAMIAFKETP
jgi:hypothetical protein